MTKQTNKNIKKTAKKSTKKAPAKKTKVLLADYKEEGYAIFDLQSYEFKNDCHIFYI